MSTYLTNFNRKHYHHHMRIILLATLLFFTELILAQDIMTIAAKIVDSETQEPIEFVNVGFIDKGIGTVSNIEGKFKLTFEKSAIGKKDFLQISSIGYETRKISYEKLKDFTSYLVNIPMKPSQTVLSQVVIKNEKRVTGVIGSTSPTAKDMGYWRNKDGLGGEIASVIRVRKEQTKLHQLNFHIIENLADSLLIRVNVYDYEGGEPGKNLLNSNIYHTVRKNSKKESIDLEDYNIIVNDDIVVSIELIESYGTTLYFSISANAYGGTSFTRRFSQDHWEVYTSIGMSFNLKTSYPANSKDKQIVQRPKVGKLKLYWDTSLMMQNRLQKEELSLLSKYLKEQGDLSVEVIKFKGGSHSAKEFEIRNGKSKALLEYLKESIYEGVADYSEVLKENDFGATAALVFTHGNSLMEPLSSNIGIPVFCINTVKDANHLNLQEISFVSGGHYINLSNYGVKPALQAMLDEMDDSELYLNNSGSTNQKGKYYGTVFNSQGPVQGASILIKNTFKEVVSDVEGNYSIDASEEDVLVVNYLGMIEKEVALSETKKVHIELKPDGELFKEVVIQGKSEKEPVNTPFGMKNPDAIGYSLGQIIEAKDINPSYTELKQILNWGVGINAISSGALEGIPVKYSFRKFDGASFGNSTFAAIVYDDIVYDQNLPGVIPPDINVQNIERITLLKSAAGTIRYGSAAAFGAIIIESKDYAKSNKWKIKEKKESALATGNDYIEKVPDIDSNLTSSDYLHNLKTAASFEEAKMMYRKELEKMNNPTIPFYLDASACFLKWDRNYAFTIASNILEVAKENPKALRALAYQLETMGHLRQAQYVYEQLLKLRPKQLQCFRDLALIYQKNGEYEKAFDLYRHMTTNAIEGIDFTRVHTLVENEFRRFLARHKSEVNYQDLSNDLLEVGFHYDTRLVFEWTDPMAEFDVQFVSPEKKFFNWSHNKFDSKDRILDMNEQGYSMEEFIIDDADSGEWLINIKYLGDEPALNPTYLRYTVYKNYGLENETQTVKIVKLYRQKNKVTLDTFLN